MDIDIKGIPPDFAPVLVETIKSQKKLLNLIFKCSKQQQQQQSTNRIISCVGHSTGKRSENEGLHNDIFQRMKETEQKDHEQHILNNIPAEIKTQAKSTSDSINTFIEKLNADLMRTSKHVTHHNNDTGNNTITLPSIDFCLDLVQEKESNQILRLAAIFITSSIIHKTNDIQFVIDAFMQNMDTKKMKKIIDSIDNYYCDSHHNLNADNSLNVSDLMLIEMWKMFTFIKSCNKNKKHEPRIIVTLRYIEEQKGLETLSSSLSLTASHYDEYKKHIHLFIRLSSPLSSVFDNSNNYNHLPCRKLAMNERRRIRDIVLLNGDKEIKRLNKIFDCINECMEIIVPRFAINMDKNLNGNDKIDQGVLLSAEDDVLGATGSGVNNTDDDSSKDYVDWEDGDDEELLFETQHEGQSRSDKQTALVKTNHIAAVEHSIAMMKETGALNQEGGLQIKVNFSSSSAFKSEFDNYFGGSTENVLESKERRESIKFAKERLDKCIKRLSDRHEPRLDAWVNALISADNMTTTVTQHCDNGLLPNPRDLQYYENSLSLVLLPLSMRQKKQSLVRILTEYKSKIVSALALAAKLGVQSKDKLVSTSSVANNDTPSENKMIQHKGEHVQKKNPNVLPWQQALGIHSAGNQMKKGTSVFSKKRKQDEKGRLQIKLRRC